MGGSINIHYTYKHKNFCRFIDRTIFNAPTTAHSVFCKKKNRSQCRPYVSFLTSTSVFVLIQHAYRAPTARDARTSAAQIANVNCAMRLMVTASTAAKLALKKLRLANKVSGFIAQLLMSRKSTTTS